MKQRHWLRSPWLGAAALFAVGLTAFFGRVLLSRGMLFLGDIAFFYYPVFAYATRSLQSGVIPLWCPELEGGMPFLGFWEGTFLYPLDILFRLAGQTWVGFNASIFFHYLLAGVGMLCYGRALGFAPLSSLVAATVFSLNGFMVTHLEHVNMIVAAAWMPWLFLAVERLWVRPTALNWAVAGAVLALQLLGGHPDVFLMSAFALGLYTLLHPTHGVLYQRALRPLGGPAALLVAVFLLGVALAAAQLVPTLALAASSWTQAQERVSTQSAASLHSREFWHLLLPNLMGRAGDDTYFGERNYWERCGYAGVLTLALAVIGWASRHRMRTFWCACTLLGLLCAMGPGSQVFSLVRELPAFGTMRLPSRWVFLFDFGIALLAGAGVQTLVYAPVSAARRRSLQWIAATMLVLTLVAGGFAVWCVWPGGSWQGFAYTALRRAHQVHSFDATAWTNTYEHRLLGDVIGLGIALLLGNALLWHRLRSSAALPGLAPLALAAVYLELFRFGVDYNPVFPGSEIAAPPRTALAVRSQWRLSSRERLARATPQAFQIFTIEHRGFWPDYSDVTERRKFLAMLPGNWNLLTGLPAFGQNDTALRIDTWRRLRAAIYLRGRTPERRLAVESRLWPWFNVGYLVSWHRVSLPGIVPLTRDHPYLYRVCGNEGRAFLRSRAMFFRQDTLLFEQLVHRPDVLPSHVCLSLGSHRQRSRRGRPWRAWRRWPVPVPAGASGAASELPREYPRSPSPYVWSREAPFPGPAVSTARVTLAPGAAPGRDGWVRLITDEPHHVELEARATRSGYLVLTDTFYPGWRARVDGHPTPILRANGVHRAVLVGSGPHRVVFRYEPAAPRLGFFLSLITLATALGIVAASVAATRAFTQARGARQRE